MAEQMRPLSKKRSPDPSRNYERSRPEDEAGMGKLEKEAGETPIARPDQAEEAVGNKRAPKELEQSP